MNKYKLGNRIREYRKKAGLRQSDLAFLTGVSKNTISSIETGVFNPSVILALSISRVLKVPFRDLFYLLDL